MQSDEQRKPEREPGFQDLGFDPERLPASLAAIRARYRREGRAEGFEAALRLLYEVRAGLAAVTLPPVIPDTAAFTLARNQFCELENRLRQALADAPNHGKKKKPIW